MTTEVFRHDVKDSIKSFISGGLGGMTVVFVGHPLDLVKVRLQTTNNYSGILHCLRSTVKADGFRGLYRGMATPLLGSTPYFAISFLGYDLGQSVAKHLWQTSDRDPLLLKQIIFAGAFSAIPSTLFNVPIERVKILLQTSVKALPDNSPLKGGLAATLPCPAPSPVPLRGPVDVLRFMYTHGGVRSLWRGTAISLCRDIPGSMAYFSAYEMAKKHLSPTPIPGASGTAPHIGAVAAAGAMAGVANWIVAIPADVVKSRIQSQQEGVVRTLSVIQQLYLAQGIRGFYRGLLPAVVRSAPANAACFLVVEMSQHLLDSLF